MAIAISMTWPQYLRSECRIGSRRVSLTTQEAEVLLMLLLRGPMYTSKEDLCEMLWANPDDQPDTAWDIVRDIISRLRIKLGKECIHSRYRLGYMLA